MIQAFLLYLALALSLTGATPFQKQPSLEIKQERTALQGEALLQELSRRAFRFFWEESHPTTGLTKDRAANFAQQDNFTVSSCASTGFALAAYPIGVERKWVERDRALSRTRLTLNSLLTLHDGHRGWFYHFVDWQTGKRVWDCELSSIDTSILLGGVLVAESYWKDAEVSRMAKTLLDRVDWEWMRTDGGMRPNEVFFSMGWRPDKGFIEARWNRYNELMMLYIQAYGASEKFPTEGWAKIQRPVYRQYDLDVLIGGPLFMHQMSHVFYDFKDKRDALGFDYWVATRNATLANRAYCVENPKRFRGYGPNFWGLSACDGPEGYSAFGAPPDKNDNGTITPTSPIASLEFTPKESQSFAEAMYRDWPKSWGRYGFSNGVNPNRDWTGPDVIGIDLGMMLMGIENYRTGLPHRLSMTHPIIRRGFERAGLRRVPGSSQEALRLPPVPLRKTPMDATLSPLRSRGFAGETRGRRETKSACARPLLYPGR